ncbi:STAS domain-containing protein [Streptacidiphilus sp. P02-A3a]|uniref:STAS domain-containing protein n=1 Tax=Streptacidiphilus sp. P02-A3a TaxID=2704468 RepID=UPI0015FD6DE2|nr:STAS domain-containing protein [Streptacidiphilus sp. P02-A3a]QMU71759.1 STAS domain-containing protein [Streptacidiphilus sp. P02-A3a]
MPTQYGLNLDRTDRGSQSTIVMAGELDLDTEPALRSMIENCLREGMRIIDVDLTGLTFCDVSGLNTFLAVTRLARTDGVVLRLHDPDPTLIRLVDLTGTGAVLSLTTRSAPTPTLALAPALALSGSASSVLRSGMPDDARGHHQRLRRRAPRCRHSG